MADPTDLRGAVEELLLSHRALIEEALHPLQEHAQVKCMLAHFIYESTSLTTVASCDVVRMCEQLDEILHFFQRCILELQHQEPAFWQLRIVEYIHHLVKAQVGVPILKRKRSQEHHQNENDDADVAPATPDSIADCEPIKTLADREREMLEEKATISRSTEFTSASEQIYRAVQDELLRLSDLVDDVAETTFNENQRGSARRCPDFMLLFWKQLERTMLERNEHSRHSQHESDTMDEAVSCSFEAISFDDLNDECESANSGPSFGNIPQITLHLQNPDPAERHRALDDLLEIPILEIVHCGSNFKSLCAAVTGLFLQTDQFKSDVKAKKLVYDLLSHVEDALVFLDVYWSVLELAGKHYESGQLCFEKKDTQTITDQAVVSAIDVYRLLLVLLTKITHHWIHFSTETMAKVLVSTFQLLIMSPTCAEGMETRLIRPIQVLSLLDKTADWFKTWLHKTPACDQVFVALRESGFVAELLQYLSRVRPLEKSKNSNPVVDEVERRTTLHLKFRQVRWTMPSEIEMECKPEENDRVCHLVTSLSIEALSDSEDEQGGTARLGEKVIEATIMSIIAVILTDSSMVLHYGSAVATRTVADCLILSISRYLPCQGTSQAIAEVILNLVERCFQLSQGIASLPVTSRTERESDESENPWFPFRRAIDLKDAEDLIMIAISVRSQSGELDKIHVQRSSQLLLNMILRLLPRTSSEDFRLSKSVQMKVFQLSRHVIQEMANRFSSDDCSSMIQVAEQSFISSLGTLLSDSEAYQLAKPLRLVQELVALYRIGLSRKMNDLCCEVLELLVATSLHTAATQDIDSCDMSEACARHLIKTWRNGTQREEAQQQILRFLVLPNFSAQFFASDIIQSLIGEVISKLLTSSVFTLAVNSSPNEYPSEVSRQMNDLMFLRCCLSTQHASTSLLVSEEHNLMLSFIVRTLIDHGEKCLASCDAEDLCTVAFEMILPMVSSVPAALQCAGVFAENKIILLLNNEHRKQRQGDDIISSCTLLGSQLQRIFEVVGGPSEKLQRCSLYEFDQLASEWSQESNIKPPIPTYTEIEEELAPFVATLLHKMVLSIQESGDRSAPLDFVMLSQATWELIHEVENSEGWLSSSLSPAQYTKVFGKLMYYVVMTRRSRLDEALVCTPRIPIRSEKELPADAQKKLMNQLYKGYCQQLGLKASPTLLHCITKKFGRHALHSFPVTILMILDQLSSEMEISAFLACCWSSPGGTFLWSSGARDERSNCESDTMPTLFRIASAVDLIMEREYPQCFWNYFDWNNIVLYIYLTVLHGPEFQVYIIVAVVKHLEPVLKALSSKYNTQSTASFLELTGRPISGFCFSQWRNLFMRLRNEYHDEVLQVLGSTDEKKRQARDI